jgi:hypothetical protein
MSFDICARGNGSGDASWRGISGKMVDAIARRIILWFLRPEKGNLLYALLVFAGKDA